MRIHAVVLALALPVGVAAQTPAGQSMPRQPVARPAPAARPEAGAAQPAPRPLAAPAASPLTAAAQSLLQMYGGNLKSAAELMPADKYGFKPTPQQMAFGEIVRHVAGSNYFMCANLADLPRPTEKLPEASASKEELVAAMQKSLDFCTDAVGKVDESRLGDEVPFFGGRKATRALVLLAVTGDLFDHYSAMAIYLRLNNILPPTARQKEGA